MSEPADDDDDDEMPELEPVESEAAAEWREAMHAKQEALAEAYKASNVGAGGGTSANNTKAATPKIKGTDKVDHIERPSTLSEAELRYHVNRNNAPGRTKAIVANDGYTLENQLRSYAMTVCAREYPRMESVVQNLVYEPRLRTAWYGKTTGRPPELPYDPIFVECPGDLTPEQEKLLQKHGRSPQYAANIRERIRAPHMKGSLFVDILIPADIKDMDLPRLKCRRHEADPADALKLKKKKMIVVALRVKTHERMINRGEQLLYYTLYGVVQALIANLARAHDMATPLTDADKKTWAGSARQKELRRDFGTLEFYYAADELGYTDYFFRLAPENNAKDLEHYISQVRYPLNQEQVMARVQQQQQLAQEAVRHAEAAARAPPDSAEAKEHLDWLAKHKVDVETLPEDPDPKE